MGKERDKEIKKHGGTALNDLNLTDREILQLARNTYWDRGETPPDISEILNKETLKNNDTEKNIKKMIKRKKRPLKGIK